MAKNVLVEPSVYPVAPVLQVLGAIDDPVRLEVVRRLYNAGAPVQCGALYDGILGMFIGPLVVAIHNRRAVSERMDW